jgi:hypothetical protein
MSSNGDEILSPKQMLTLAETPEGRRVLASYIISARIGYAMQAVFEMLNVVPEPGVQTKCCERIYDTLFRVPVDDIMQWCQQVAVWKKEEYHEGNC